jgi:type II secretory pathway pseudopilin PulG
MTEMQKKTLGLAIASLICGCFSLIPIIGLLPSVPAIILGIVALVKISKNKDTLKGSGLAISGIVLGSLGILFLPIVGLLAAIAIPNLMRARISANDALAKSTIQTLSTASQTYQVDHNGRLPQNIQNLTEATPPYLNQNYCQKTISGYTYTCEFRPDGYVFTATPAQAGTTGTKIFTITDGHELSIEETQQGPSYPSEASEQNFSYD